VLLGVNMQTSFMHPPFGFALFYLRSVAPAKEYLDRVSKKMIAGVTTGQIYWGAVPFVMIQILMVGLVIAFPELVLVYKAGEMKIDIKSIQIIVPEEQPAFPATPGDAKAPEAGGAAEQDAAEKALEKALGGGSNEAAKDGGNAPGTPGATQAPGASGESAPAVPAPEDPTRGFEKALREQMGNAPAAPK
jgi:hypothetical protein